MPDGTRLVLNFGATAVPHSPSERERWIDALTSTARPRLTMQDGLVTARKSWLLAQDNHDFDLAVADLADFRRIDAIGGARRTRIRRGENSALR